MKNSDKQQDSTSHKAGPDGTKKMNIAGGQDLPDDPKDLEKLKADTASFELPEVKDIPGQEHIRPAPLGELADTTISSADEEGEGIIGFNDDEDAVNSSSKSNVTATEKQMLEQTRTDQEGDDERLRLAALDSTDEDGVPLNEKGFGRDISGEDLDVPGADLDDANENIGEEDEENNLYSNSDN